MFEITAKDKKGEEVSIIIDPFQENVGLRTPKIKSNILMLAAKDEKNSFKEAKASGAFLIDGPGEYEVRDVFIQGIYGFALGEKKESRKKIMIYIIETEGIKICHLSSIYQTELTAEQIEAIGDVDILMIPVGGVYTIGAELASKIIKQIEPRVVIPMNYKIPKLALKLESLDKFLKIMGAKSGEPMNKLNIKKKDLSGEETKVIILNP